MSKAICLFIGMFLLFGVGYPLEFKCWNVDEKTMLCDIPIEPFFEEQERTISDISATEPISIRVFGTDYFIGEQNATAFLQLLNSSNEPITNSTCFVSIWNPDKTAFLLNASMSYHTEGLFYYDYSLPSTEGVYMVSAKCSLPKLAESVNYTQTASDNFDTGTFSGGTGWNDDWILFGEFYSTSTAQAYSPSYSALLTKLGTIGRSVDLTGYKNLTISFWAYLQSIDANEFAYFKVNDGNMQTIKSWDSTEDNATWVYYEYAFPEGTFNPTCNFEVWFSLFSDSTADYFYIDDINITGWKYNYTEVEGYSYQEVRGSGEVHVINPISTIINGTYLYEELSNLIFSVGSMELQSNHDYCLDNMTLGKNLTYSYTIGSKTFNFTRYETIPCEFGCENSKCTNPTDSWLLIAGVLTTLLLLGFFLKKNQK